VLQKDEVKAHFLGSARSESEARVANVVYDVEIPSRLAVMWCSNERIVIDYRARRVNTCPANTTTL
jgi:hypothetical protein